MKHSKNNILGVVGVFATGALTVLFMTALFQAGPRALLFLHTPLELLLEFLSGSMNGSREHALLIAYWLYLLLFGLLSVVFGWAFWVRTSLRNNRSPQFNAFLLVLQMFIALCIHQEQPHAILVAAELAFVLPRRTAFYWLGAQMMMFSAMQIPILLGFGNWFPALDLAGSILNSCLTLVWLGIAFGVGYLASAERRGRIKLAVAHAELLATQQLLTDTLRVSERVRMSRNLHDAIGHHLTALNLHLDLGLRQTGLQALESFHLSSKLAQSLLEEVRAVVSIDREDQIIELRHALETLCSGIPVPRIALAYDETIEISDPAVAHSIFRSVQEAITNAVRHSGAAVMEIGLQKRLDGVAIVIDDNGKGMDIDMDQFELGNGLRGMRERIQLLSGTLNITNRPTGGCRLQIWLPKLGAAL
jgi:two-component system sensor histidine kinase DesK